MHDLLEILEHAYSLLDGFSSIHISTCFTEVLHREVVMQ